MKNRLSRNLRSPVRYAGWPFALGITVTAVLCELIPYIFGVGKSAKFDWSWMYVTIHFVVLPAVCVVHILMNFYTLTSITKSNIRERLLSVTSVVVSIAYLLLLWWAPIFPLNSSDSP